MVGGIKTEDLRRVEIDLLAPFIARHTNGIQPGVEGLLGNPITIHQVFCCQVLGGNREGPVGFVRRKSHRTNSYGKWVTW